MYIMMVFPRKKNKRSVENIRKKNIKPQRLAAHECNEN